MTARLGEHYTSKRFKTAVLHFLTGKFVSGLLGVATLVLVVRGLEVMEYGVYVTLIAAQLMLLGMSSFGIEAATERFIPELRVKHAPHELAFVILAGLLARLATLVLLVGILWGVIDWLITFAKLGEWREEMLSYVKVVFAAGMFQIFGAVLEALLLQKWAQVSLVINMGIRFFMIAWLFHQDEINLAGVIRAEWFGFLVGVAVCTSVILFYFRKELHWKKPINFNLGDLWLRMRRFAFFNYFAQICMQAYGQEMMRLLVTRMLGVAETARYGFVVNIIDIVSRYLPAVLLLRLIRPIFISRYAANQDFLQLNAFAVLVLKLNLFILAPLIAYLVVFGGQIISLITGGKYVDAHWLLVGLAVLLMPVSHQWVISLTANTLERNELQFRGALISIVGLPVAFMSMDALGVYGALAGSFSSAVVYNTFAVWYLRKEGFPYQQDLLGMSRIFVAGLVAGGVGWLVAPLEVSWLAAGAVLGAIGVTYILCCVAIKPFSSDERKLLNSVSPLKIFVF